MGVPEHIRNRQRGDVTLPSGLVVGIRLRNARDLMFGGGMAWPVIERMAELETKGDDPDLDLADKLAEATEDTEVAELLTRLAARLRASKAVVSELTEEEKAELYRFQREQVAPMIETLPDEAGEQQPASVTADELDWLDDGDFYALVAYMMRSKELPKA